MSKIKTTINDITFEIITKCVYNNREFIKLKSINRKNEAKIFYIFNSKTTFGLWKLYCNEDVEQPETMINTLINMELQRFIYSNYEKIPIDINIKNEIKKYKNTQIAEIITNKDRVETLPEQPVDELSEYLYYDVMTLIGILNELTNTQYPPIRMNENDEPIMPESEKISLIKKVKSTLQAHYAKHIKVIEEQPEFEYKSNFDSVCDKQILLCNKIYKLQVLYMNQQYTAYKIVYNFTSEDKQCNDCVFILTFLKSTLCNEYGLYNTFYNNLYNKLIHFIYDDECFLNEDIIQTFRIEKNSNILYVGDVNDFK